MHTLKCRLPFGSGLASLALATALCVSALMPASAQTPVDNWQWPASAESQALRDSINGAQYTPEELRFVRRTLEFYADNRRTSPEEWDKWFAPEYKTLLTGMQTLRDTYKEVHGRTDGYRPPSMENASIPNRADKVVDIIAKGNRVFVTWMITGNLEGTYFGFEGKGQPVEFRESAIMVYDTNGLATYGTYFFGDEMQMYLQAGGEITLPN